jgi:hypothetical protein
MSESWGKKIKNQEKGMDLDVITLTWDTGY